jgi:hypothetical protein
MASISTTSDDTATEGPFALPFALPLPWAASAEAGQGFEEGATAPQEANEGEGEGEGEGGLG